MLDSLSLEFASFLCNIEKGGGGLALNINRIWNRISDMLQLALDSVNCLNYFCRPLCVWNPSACCTVEVFKRSNESHCTALSCFSCCSFFRFLFLSCNSLALSVTFLSFSISTSCSSFRFCFSSCSWASCLLFRSSRMFFFSRWNERNPLLDLGIHSKSVRLLQFFSNLLTCYHTFRVISLMRTSPCIKEIFSCLVLAITDSTTLHKCISFKTKNLP